jgi:two-component sensor histidine kinase
VPELLCRYGVISAVNVIIRTESMVFGVLEADSRQPGEFTDADTQFLQSYANILALAIAQHQLAEENRSLSEYAALLLQEFRHRTKNTQQMLFSLLSMKRQEPAGSSEDRMLDSILSYLQTLNRLDEMLIAAGPMRQINLTEYLGDVASSLLRPHRHDTSKISLAVSDQPVITSGDQAQKLGLILAEFIINSIKYASDAEDARILVVLSQRDGLGCLELRDQGPGIPPDVTPGTGMRIIAALGKALRGEVKWSSGQGARLLVRFPVAADNGTSG